MTLSESTSIPRASTSEAEDRLAYLSKQVEAFTLRPCAETSQTEPFEVVVVPLGGDLGRGFARARGIVEAGGIARLVGHGITVPETWPDWIATLPGIWLTELGAYKYETTLEATAELRARLRRWTEETFDGVVPLRAGDVFYGSTMGRFFQIVLDAGRLARGIAKRHADQNVSFTEPWVGEAFVHPTRFRRTLPRQIAWQAMLGATTAAAWGATIVKQTQRFRASQRSFARLAELAKRRQPGPPPSAWVTLTADQVRANRHIIESVVKPELEGGNRLGLLLFQSISSGERLESNIKQTDGNELWPGLKTIEHRLEECVIEQVVGADSASELVKELSAATAATLRVFARLARRRPAIDAGPFDFPLMHVVVPVAQLITLDIARAVAAHRATTRMLAHCDVRGAKIIFSHSSHSDSAANDIALQAAGARTIELCHGTAGADWHGTAEVASQVRGLWSNIDAELNALSGKEVFVGGMPFGAVHRHERTRTPRKILLMTGYVHRDSVIQGRFPDEPLIYESLRISREVPALLGDRFEFRWRPHPADDASRLRHIGAQFPNLVRSAGGPLADDIAWADIIVSNQSSSLVEALFADVPIFMHAFPMHVPAEIRYVEPGRRFFRAKQMASQLATYLRGLEDGDLDVLRVEQRSRQILFGSGEKPLPFSRFLRPDTAQRTS